MKSLRAKILSVAMSIVLAFGLFPLTASAAQPDRLQAGSNASDSSGLLGAQAEQDGFVADRVYALIGNDYAMLISEENSTRTVDIIDTNYNKTAEFVETATDEYGYAFNPQTDYGYVALEPDGIVVRAKDSGLQGYMALNGSLRISASYDGLSANGDYIMGYSKASDGTGTITVLNRADGKQIASANVGAVKNWLYAYWSSNDSITVTGLASGNGASSSAKYTFSNSKLAFDSMIPPTEPIIGKLRYETSYDSTTYTPTTRYYLNDNEVSVLQDYKFCFGELIDGGVALYLFYRNGSSEVKLVNTQDATVAFDFSNSSTLAGKTVQYWDTVGNYAVCHTNSTLECYQLDAAAKTLKHVKSIVYAPAESLVLAKTQSGYYYTVEPVDVYTGYGYNGMTSKSRVVQCYDSNLSELNSRPALGAMQTELQGVTYYGSGLERTGTYYDPHSEYEPNVLTADGKPLTIGAATIVRPTRNPTIPTAKTSISDLQFNDKDAFAAKSASGKYGAVSLDGQAVVPLQYDDYFSGASMATRIAKSDYAMVKQSGRWYFYKVNAKELTSPEDKQETQETPGGSSSSDNSSSSGKSTSTGKSTTSSSSSPSQSKSMTWGVKAGSTVKIAGATYKTDGNSKPQITYKKAPKSKKSVTIPESVVIKGRKYKVTGIAKKAFKGTKVKTVALKTAALTKKSVKGSLKGSKVKTIKVKLSSKWLNKRCKQTYKKVFSKKNCGKRVKIK